MSLNSVLYKNEKEALSWRNNHLIDEYFSAVGEHIDERTYLITGKHVKNFIKNLKKQISEKSYDDTFYILKVLVNKTECEDIIKDFKSISNFDESNDKDIYIYNSW